MESGSLSELMQCVCASGRLCTMAEGRGDFIAPVCGDMICLRMPVRVAEEETRFVSLHLLTVFLWLSSGCLFNSLVHVVMYYYYMLVTLGKSVWWKKYLTVFQVG